MAIKNSEKIKKILDLYSKNSSKIFKIAVLVILFFSLLIRIYWGNQKEGLHMDEVLSIMFANNVETQIKFDYGKEYSGKKLKKETFLKDSSVKDAFLDVGNLYLDSKDKPHTNFYYSLLRLSFIGRTVTSYQEVIRTGLLLNFIFFLVEYLFLYKLLSLFFKERNDLILSSLFFVSTAVFSISSSLFLRPYQLQTTIFMVFSFVFFDILINKKYSWKRMALLAMTTALTFLTGYFSIVFIFLNLLFASVYLYFTKNSDKLRYLLGSFVSSIFLVQLMYLNYWQVIFMGQDRAGEAYLKINLSYIFKNFFELFGIYCELIYSSAVYIIPLIVVFSSILILSRKKENKFNNTARPYIYISFLSSLFFSIIALWLAPIKIIRYIAPVLPFTLLIIPYGASLIKNKKIRYFLLLCLVCVYGFNAFNPSKIDYLYKNKNQEIRVLKDEKKPLYLLSDVNYRMFLEWVPYSKDKDRLFFSNNAEECYNLINLGDSSSLYVAIDAEYDSTKKEKLINLIGEKYFIVNNFFTRSGDTAGFNLLELQIKQ